MIALLTGVLRTLDPHNLILDVNGVGYQVAITGRTHQLLGGIGTTATLHIVTQVREDAITLFGFATTDEKETFTKLTTVQGVGAKMALSLLSTLSPAELWQAIIADNKKILTAADGVGPKLAARLTTELKDYAGKQVFPGTHTSTARTSGLSSSVLVTTVTPSGPQHEAISALMNLGYAPVDATRAVTQIANENQDADLSTLIRLALRAIAG